MLCLSLSESLKPRQRYTHNGRKGPHGYLRNLSSIVAIQSKSGRPNSLLDCEEIYDVHPVGSKIGRFDAVRVYYVLNESKLTNK